MPAEASRLSRRLGARDRRFLAALACTTVVGVPTATLLQRANGGTAESPRCVSVTRASIMGGATYHYCGAGAVAACKRALGRADTSLVAKCRRDQTAR